MYTGSCCEEERSRREERKERIQKRDEKKTNGEFIIRVGHSLSCCSFASPCCRVLNVGVSRSPAARPNNAIVLSKLPATSSSHPIQDKDNIILSLNKKGASVKLARV